MRWRESRLWEGEKRRIITEEEVGIIKWKKNRRTERQRQVD